MNKTLEIAETIHNSLLFVLQKHSKTFYTDQIQFLKECRSVLLAIKEEYGNDQMLLLYSALEIDESMSEDDIFFDIIMDMLNSNSK